MKVNEEINSSEVLLLTEDGTKVGLVSLEIARENATQLNLDLVEVGNDDDLSICKLMDYGKFKYEKNKRDKKNKQQSKKPPLKEIRLGINTADHDKEFKMEHAKKFIQKGHDVKITIQLKGREKEFLNYSEDILKDIKNKFRHIATTKQDISSEGRVQYIILSPAS